MRKSLVKLREKVVARLLRARGQKILELKFFGFQLFLLAEPDKWHKNIFIFYIPVLRIDTEPTKFGINLLLLAWFYKIIKYLFTKWTYVRKEDEVQLLFCGLSIFHRKDTAPFKFPTAMFHG